MSYEYYKVNSRLQISNDDSIPVLKPDHVSLGKCVTSHQFIHKYGTINDIDVVNMLRDDCEFLGFKKISIESNEEEGFANMHHVLRLRSRDEIFYKEVCVQRTNGWTLDHTNLPNQNEVVTAARSVVILLFNKVFIDAFYFENKHMKHFKMDYPQHDVLLYLTAQILYISSKVNLSLINFRKDAPFLKSISVLNRCIVSFSTEMLVMCMDPPNEPILMYDMLQDDTSQFQLVIPETTLQYLLLSQILVVSTATSNLIWLVCNNDEFFIYKFNQEKELQLMKKMSIKAFFPSSNGSEFQKVSYCYSTSQAFLLYIQDYDTDPTSFIVVLNLEKFNVISMLEMEFTLNRKPKLIMYPSWDGTKLFVQETFENKVIFYQVFTLLPSDFSLQSITKRYIYKSFSEDAIKCASIPKFLKVELLSQL